MAATHWNITVIIICVVVLLLTLWQEYRRTNRSRLGWRVLAILLAVTALACIALPLTYSSQRKATDGSDAVLLTEGYSADSISNHHYPVIFTTDKNIKKQYPKATWVSSLSDIIYHHPAIKQLHILGYGLNEYELQQLTTIPLSYQAPVTPAGLQRLSWPENLKAGEALQVQGHYQSAADKPVKVLLKGLNTGLDSITLPAHASTDFELSAIPKNTGRAVYSLLTLSGNDTLAHESLPVQVEAVKPIKLLMLTSSPDFETRFLKNWLSENGYSVAVRSVISKDKISQDYVNIDKLSLEHLTPALLSKFDVVLGDLSTLKALNASESGALKQEVLQKGLGVIVRADSAGNAASWLQTGFQANAATAKAQLNEVLTLQNQKAKTARLLIDPSYVSAQGNTQNLVYDSQNHVLAATALTGSGQRVFTTLNHTFAWLMAGNNKDYAALWSLLIGKAARKLPSVPGWMVASALPMLNEPVQLQLQSASTPAQVQVNGIHVAPVQNASIPYLWTVNYWPTHAGWQQINTSNGTPSWCYVYENKRWNSLKAQQKIAITQKSVANSGKNATVTKQIQQNTQIELPKMYFYLLLLTTCTFLWIERKLIA
ncbi:hypothetical protein HH214_04020 [Mucilaginibacter robiniae]|uniref:Aerotolerance regulator N-terminal domain-containing protein n=1 Tax=Mucilaginibacter robiniae TaxID=2728022 RepID=A0A7L5DVJ9_9SPHI|nr:hypothetical protein [Mucilaginibacter robiniae]QJD95102.1 hypothetical protein HH214_04020 [Mucilaginibacter robiniae]